MRAFISMFFQVSAAACVVLSPALALGEMQIGSGTNVSESSPTGIVKQTRGFQLVQLPKANASEPAFPPVRVQVQIGTQQRRVGQGTFRKQMEIEPKIVIDGVTRSTPIPAAEAVMIIVTMDTRAKYVDKREVYKVESAQTLPIPAAQTGDRRQFEFDPTMVSFDSWRDHTNVGGAVYKYFVFALRDPATKTIIDFQTNNPQLASLGKTSPQRREEFLGFSRGDVFPTTIK